MTQSRDPRRSQAPISLIAVALASAIVSATHAQWTATSLNPAGLTRSFATGASGAQQVGMVVLGGKGHPSVWSGSAATWIDLYPAGVSDAVATGTSGGQQAGCAYYLTGDPYHAGMWTGSAASWVDLNPAGSHRSLALGIGSGQQVGFAEGTPNGSFHASLWTGTPASWIDLNPSGADYSEALAADGGQQVGFSYVDGVNCASLWSGTAPSWINLNPVGSSGSWASGVGGGQQVGYVDAEGGLHRHAALWSGTAASWIDLHPPGMRESQAQAACNGQQVGFAVTLGGVPHAALWNGTAGSWVDLGSFLSPRFTESHATGIATDGTVTYITGDALDGTTGQLEAVLWTKGTNCNPITTQPQSVFLVVGETAVFTIHASDPDATYQWRRYGTSLVNSARVSGATGQVLTIAGMQSGDQGVYDCVASNACGAATSNLAELTCRAVVTHQPEGGSSVGAHTFVLSASVTTGGTTGYRWKKDGVNVFNGSVYSGVTTRTLTINGNDPSQSGAYTLVITNPCGSTITNPAIITITCHADFNGDDTVDFFDYDAFVTCFEGDACPTNKSADFNDDGSVDFFDYDAFVQAFESGC